MSADKTPPTSSLTFDSDPGSSRPKWVAGALIVILIAWMGSGFILPSSDPQAAAPDRAAARPVAVAVQPSVASSVELIFIAEGQAMPDRDTTVRAETSGQIAQVLVEKGDDLTAGQVIARISTTERVADLNRAQQELQRAQRDFDNSESLLERGVATADRVAQARVALAAAEAGVAASEKALEDTAIRAPFDGRLEALDLDEGEFVSTGADVARIVDNSPLTINIQIPQQSRSDIAVGQGARVEFITGGTSTGEVTFLGSSADAATRTFAAEIEVPNADGSIPAGVSAQVRIPTGTETAHFVSPAILSLGTDGTLGVKTVTDDNTVEFHKVRIVRAQTDGIWIAGLPNRTQIIIVGQGFVNAGDTVNPQTDERAAPADAPPTTADAATPPDTPEGSGEIIDRNASVATENQPGTEATE